MKRPHLTVDDRRAFCVAVSASLVGLAASACGSSSTKSAKSPSSEGDGGGEEAEVTPGEDLMQEHGVVDRILLIYEEAASRLDGSRPFEPALLSTSAAVVRRFVEDYHEKLEETFVFPRLEQAGKEVELVATLKEQHAKGRVLTDAITAATSGSSPLDGAKVSGLLRAFVRMYRPHTSREETVLFPTFRRTMDRDAYRELGERFEEKEHALFGEAGFEEVVAQLSKIEVALEIHDLARFSPP